MGMFLLVLRPAHVRIVLGVLGRALATLDFELFGYCYLSNHGSLIIGVRDEAHQAEIMEFIHSPVQEPRAGAVHGDPHAGKLGSFRRRVESEQRGDQHWDRGGRAELTGH